MSKKNKTSVVLPAVSGKTFPFNKKNTLALADFIFSDKNGEVSFLKLCHGKLKNGKDGNRTTHCAVGEAYWQFVSHDMSKILKKDTMKDEYGSTVQFESEYCEKNGPTGAVITALVESAQLKNSKDKYKLGRALAEAVSENDFDAGYDTLENHLSRSERVANVFRDKVAPLLK